MSQKTFRALDNLTFSDIKLSQLPRKADAIYNMVYNEYGQLEKRKGYEKYNITTLSADHKIVGMHRFYNPASSSKEFLVACNTAIYKLAEASPHAGTAVSTGFTITADQETFFATFYESCYIVNGANGVMKYDGTNFESTGITVPTAPTFSANTNGSLTAGSYYFKVSYVDSDGYESNLSESSAAMTAEANPNDGITITIPVSSDSKVAKRRIYRTTVGGQKFYYDGEVANNTAVTYSSTQSDDTIAQNTEAHSDHDAPPSTPHLISKRRSRLILADGGTFYISHVADVEYFPALWVIYTGYRQKITGMLEQKDDLPVFTEDSIERLVGYDEDDFEFVNSYSTEGNIAIRSLVNCNNLLVFLGCDGIYYFDMVTAKHLSETLSKYVKTNINPDYAYLAAGCFFDNLYLLSYPKGASEVPNETVYVDFSTGAVGIFSYAFGSFCRWDRGSDGIQLFGGSTTEGRVYKIGEALTDDGSDIACYDRVEPLDFGIPDRDKLFHNVWVKVENTTGTSIRLYYTIDDGTETYKDHTLIADSDRWYQIKLPSNLRGKAISIRPYVSDAYTVKFKGYMIDYDVEAQTP